MALNIEEIIASVKEATVLELNDLVKAIEEEFGVTLCCSCSCSWRSCLLAASLKSKANSTLSLLVQVLRKSKLSKLFVKSLVLA